MTKKENTPVAVLRPQVALGAQSHSQSSPVDAKAGSSWSWLASLTLLVLFIILACAAGGSYQALRYAFPAETPTAPGLLRSLIQGINLAGLQSALLEACAILATLAVMYAAWRVWQASLDTESPA